MTVVDTGLAAEYAAIYAYSAAAVHLDGDPRWIAEELESEHRSRRDALLDYYDEHGLEAAPSLAGYDIEPIADAAAAQELLLGIEQHVTATWRAGVVTTEPHERELCLRMYGDSAVALARWRIAVGQSAADPWPGRPA
ncbi:DUF4439 domain-containing protein [Glycomyces algeriensis]|uniref:DUF4439 domain-containing protein n=1 Tax=Glycomyces algeriensis TaxID=256037 RepID=A0A9W6LGN8_9ACTN|nr:DUF4439 domain-containing protein [Glycomyces algeriensis]MDA1365272.1 DUF4439 domain-containing protein [Glycomyces algeriensis]MDR7349665.1 hypothetical protein [Glycomyces algeriensis]GLI42375.1 hypothetical protein GALLR39Z86_22250 [Glycomyces algeriensis]